MAALLKKYSVGTSPIVNLGTSDINEVLIIKASDSNTGIVYVGFGDAAVTANSDTAHDGMPLSAGQSLPITPFMCGRNAANIYVVADTASQTIFVQGW